MGDKVLIIKYEDLVEDKKKSVNQNFKIYSKI